MTGQTAQKLEEEAPKEGPAPEQKPEAGIFRNWDIRRDARDIVWAVLDKKDGSTNTLSSDVLEELNTLLGELEDKRPKGLVIRSAKKSGFCAGADISEFREITDESTIAETLKKGHGVLDRLEKLPFPTVAVIHGHCLGGGLELALACDMRIGIKGMQAGFPEIRLGLHPGLGGTFRMLGLINPVQAMTMMLTGKSAHDSRARKLGIIDTLIEERHMQNAANAAVDGDLSRHRQGWGDKLMLTTPLRMITSYKMRKMSRSKAPKKHYPAPYAMIDLWEETGGNKREMQKREIKSFARLLSGETAQNLIRVFFLQQDMKSLAGRDKSINHVHVVGAGAMGADIAAWCAFQGLRVTLTDMDKDQLGRAVKKCEKLCRKKHKKPHETRDILDRFIPDPEGLGASKAELIIEAVPERPELKEKVYAGLESVMRDDAILATNTSSIPLEELATKLKRPERFVGLHFFNPVAQMMVVEVVTHGKLDETTKKAALAFTGQIGKLPAPVGSAPGFLVNRALMPYLMEAMVMVDEGTPKETIDRAALDFGMPMGPVELADQVGLDICLHVAETLKKGVDKDMADIPQWLRDKVDAGNLGKKSGKGFYRWSKGKPEKDSANPVPDRDMTDRLILPLLDACVECWSTGVVDDLDILDGAMIFGTGFAPFTGGPVNYARARGIDDIIQRLDHFADIHGPRFNRDEGWEKLKSDSA